LEVKLEIDFLQAGFWFVLGAVCYGFLSSLLAISRVINIYHQCILTALSVLKMSDEHLNSANEIKYKSLKSDGNEEHLEAVKEHDRKIVASWRTLCIFNLAINIPKKYRRLITFTNWSESMQFLSKNTDKYIKGI
jgi:hypothetical protein